MPIRRPEDAGSVVAAMAGGQGLRSSRPGHKKPRTTKVGVPGDRGRPGGSHRGEEGGRGSSAAVVRAKVRTAAGGDPPCGGCGLPRRESKRKTARGQQGARGGSAAI